MEIRHFKKTYLTYQICKKQGTKTVVRLLGHCQGSCYFLNEHYKGGIVRQDY
jgi:hypothetical protein